MILKAKAAQERLILRPLILVRALSPKSLPSLTHSRLRQVALIRAFDLVEGMGSNVSYQGEFRMLLIIANVI
jgi:hypothetical protein